jgi:uncharacterized OsmC-like protein
VRIEQQQDFRVAIVWDPERPPLIADEPPPLGGGEGPSPGQLLLGAVGNCMTDSLLFALRKFKLDAEPLSAQVDATVGRNAEGRQRFLSIEVSLALGRLPDDAAKLARALSQFEQFCTVGQSVAQGIPTRVSVRGPDGALLHGDAR